MKILLSNDDGYDAPGLMTLYDALTQVGEVTVVAPERNCSGSSNALSLRKPIRIRTRENGFFSVDGTPADCVHLAVTGMLEFEPDIVVSGINNGSNLGDDVIYSGTVAAAIEGRFLRLPALAVSLSGEQLNHFDTAARVVLKLLENIQGHPYSEHCLLNINVPDIPFDNLNGFEVTRLGRRTHSEAIIHQHNDNSLKGGESTYWIGPPGQSEDAGTGTDFFAISQNKVSITPLTIDMTHHNNIAITEDWLKTVG